ncbi:hypothetical protein H310_00223 [Aphanomyces invadans]|uniref:Uncharacterized protein n=1 Tax=Aphanomyces invadans TaxID=157072 RepID=A0A024UTP9_9STRA|nr:hypothetical protein H310_00223 [Aphanomyces invadans]ETW09734.1 hypothetical protein H310_00223 [Aphanomyces invadans]|eukprot:XP_008861145.1 hypothetical protein H310_00223 [Aphanomyces invadans]
MEVTLLRDLVEWLEHRVCSFYSRFKMLKIPIFPSLVGITEAVAVRVGVPHLFHGIARIAEPWVSSVDAILGGLVLNIIRFIMRICGLEVDDNRSVVSITRSTAQLDRTIEKLENELVRVQTQLAIEKREKDDLNATVRRVLVMMTHENDALEAFCDDQASTHISSARNKFLEDEIAVVRQEAAALASANDELRRESATVGHLATTSVSKHNLDAQGLVVTATSEASGSSISSTVPPAIMYLAEATLRVY